MGLDSSLLSTIAPTLDVTLCAWQFFPCRTRCAKGRGLDSPLMKFEGRRVGVSDRLHDNSDSRIGSFLPPPSPQPFAKQSVAHHPGLRDVWYSRGNRQRALCQCRGRAGIDP
eukprot:3938999-Rhodomonas_salina.1